MNNKTFLDDLKKKLKLNGIDSLKSAFGLPSQIYQTNIFNRHYIDSAVMQSCGDFFFSDSDDYVEFKREIEKTFKRNYKNPSFYVKKMKGNETKTENKIIKPILNALGWPEYNISERSKIPYVDSNTGVKSSKEIDLVLFESEEIADYFNDKNSKKKVDKEHLFLELKKEAQLIVEAKTIGSLEYTANESSRVKDSRKPGEDTPNAQTYFYMKKLGLKYSVLTDGRFWRLIFDDETRDDYDREQNPYFQIDINQIYQLYRLNESSSNEKNQLVYEVSLSLLYNFFSKETVQKYGKKEESVLNHLVEHRKNFFTNLDEKIGPRFVLAMTHLSNGFVEEIKAKGEDPEDYKNLIRSTSESFLFTLMFFRSLEMKNILPYFNSKDNYKEKFSISYIIEDVLYKNNKTFSKKGNDDIQDLFTNVGMNVTGTDGNFLYKRIISAIKHIVKGKSKSFMNFQQSVFNNEEKEFNENFSPKDRHFLNAIYYLFFIPLDKETVNDSLQLIPYESMTPREIGTLYESFLEYEISKVEGSSIYWNMKSKKWAPFKRKDADSLDLEKVRFRAGSYVFKHRKDNERKKTGSYYTPDYIVKYVVKQTLEPMLKGMGPKELLELNICDPAMGSGHFLSEVLDFLTSKFYEFEHEEMLTYQEASRLILENCIHGVDLNPSAVKLSKMTLWMKTACEKFSLEDLSKKIICSDSLIKLDWRKKFKNVDFSNGGGFDAIVGNPPYLNIFNIEDVEFRKELSDSFEIARNKCDLYAFFVEKSYRLLRESGRLGFITSNSWLGTQSFELYRKFLVENTKIEELVNIPKDVFESATVKTAIIIFTKEKVVSNAIKLKKLNNQTFSRYGYDLKYSDIRSTAASTFTFDEVVKLEIDTIRLGDICTFSLGIKTSDDKRFISNEAIDSDSYKLLRGRSISRFKSEVPDEWIWYRPDLMKERKGAGPRKIEIFEVPEKIMIMDIAKEIIAAMDDKKYLCNDTINLIYETSKGYNLFFILALLNSSYVNKWFKTNFPAGLHIKNNQLKEVPIPLINNDNKAIVKDIIKLSKKISRNYSEKQYLELDSLINGIYSAALDEEVLLAA